MDRNKQLIDKRCELGRSLSARRAWIEIVLVCLGFSLLCVALRKESVDRNASAMLNT